VALALQRRASRFDCLRLRCDLSLRQNYPAKAVPSRVLHRRMQRVHHAHGCTQFPADRRRPVHYSLNFAPQPHKDTFHSLRHGISAKILVSRRTSAVSARKARISVELAGGEQWWTIRGLTRSPIWTATTSERSKRPRLRSSS